MVARLAVGTAALGSCGSSLAVLQQRQHADGSGNHGTGRLWPICAGGCLYQNVSVTSSRPASTHSVSSMASRSAGAGTYAGREREGLRSGGLRYS
jgi:hypothetical protein